MLLTADINAFVITRKMLTVPDVLHQKLEF